MRVLCWRLSNDHTVIRTWNFSPVGWSFGNVGGGMITLYDFGRIHRQVIGEPLSLYSERLGMTFADIR